MKQRLGIFRKILLFFFALIIFSYLIIPLDAFRPLIFQKIESVSGIKIESSHLSLALPLGFRLERATISMGTMSFPFNSITIRPQLSSIIPGLPKLANISGDFADGPFECVVGKSADNFVLKLNLSSANLQKMEMIQTLLGSSPEGFISTDLDLVLGTHGDITGPGKIVLSKVKLPRVKIPQLYNLELPPIKMSTGQIVFSGTKGVLSFPKGSSNLGAPQDDIQVAMDGSLDLNKKSANLQFKTNFSQSILAELPILDTYFEAGKVGNSYHFRLEGPLDTLQPTMGASGSSAPQS